MCLDRLIGRGVGDARRLGQHVLRQGDDDRARPAGRGDVEGPRDELRQARRVVDLGRPFGDRAEHGAVVELLESLALAHVAPDLADEHDQRRRILPGDVDAWAKRWSSRAHAW